MNNKTYKIDISIAFSKIVAGLRRDLESDGESAVLSTYASSNEQVLFIKWDGGHVSLAFVEDSEVLRHAIAVVVPWGDKSATSSWLEKIIRGVIYRLDQADSKPWINNRTYGYTMSFFCNDGSTGTEVYRYRDDAKIAAIDYLDEDVVDRVTIQKVCDRAVWDSYCEIGVN